MLHLFTNPHQLDKHLSSSNSARKMSENGENLRVSWQYSGLFQKSDRPAN